MKTLIMLKRTGFLLLLLLSLLGSLSVAYAAELEDDLQIFLNGSLSGGEWLDVSGNARNFTNTNGVQKGISDIINHTIMNFSSSLSAYANQPSAIAVTQPDGDDDFSISVWINATDWTDNEKLWSNTRDQGVYGDGYLFNDKESTGGDTCSGSIKHRWEANTNGKIVVFCQNTTDISRGLYLYTVAYNASGDTAYIWINGTRVNTFVQSGNFSQLDGEVITSGGTNGRWFISRIDSAHGTFVNSDQTGWRYYNRTLQNDDVQAILNFGGAIPPTPSTVSTERLTRVFVNNQDVDVTVGSAVFADIISVSVSIDAATQSWLSATIPITQVFLNSEATCRILVNGSDFGSTASRTNVNGEDGSFTISTDNVSLIASDYNMSLQCARTSGVQSFVITNASLIGHIMLDEDNNTISYDFEEFTETVNNNTLTLLHEYNYTAGNISVSGLNRSVVVEWVANYTFLGAGTMSTLLRIGNTNCSLYPRYGSGGSIGSVGGTCLFDAPVFNSLTDMSYNGYRLNNGGADYNVTTQAYEFDGVSGHLGGNPVIPDGTVSFYVRATPSSGIAATSFLLGGDNSGDDRSFQFRINNNGAARCRVFNTSGSTTAATTAGDYRGVTNDFWCIYNGSLISMIVTGQETVNTSFSGSFQGTNNLSVGSTHLSLDTSVFNGSMLSVAVFGRALSAGERSVVEAGSPLSVDGLVAYYPFTDFGVRPDTTLIDRATYTREAVNNGATYNSSSQGYNFNGVNQYLELGDIDINEGNVTVKFVLPRNISEMPDVDLQLIDKDGQFSFRLDADTTDKLQLILWDAAGTPGVRGTKTDWEGGVEYEVSFVTNGTHMQMYLDGVVEGASTAYTAPLDASATPTRVGIANGLVRDFNGTINDVSIVNNSSLIYWLPFVQDNNNTRTIPVSVYGNGTGNIGLRAQTYEMAMEPGHTNSTNLTGINVVNNTLVNITTIKITSD